MAERDKMKSSEAETDDTDRANAGAIVSRAHRAEKASGQSPDAARRASTSTRSGK